MKKNVNALFLGVCFLTASFSDTSLSLASGKPDTGILAEDLASDIKAKLAATKRGIIWSTPVKQDSSDTGMEATYGIHKIDVPTCKSYVNLLYSIVIADGILSEAEKQEFDRTINSAGLDKLLDTDSLNQVAKYTQEILKQTEFKHYTEEQLTHFAEQHAVNLKGLGYDSDGDVFQASVKAALCDGITIASSDGYHAQEKKTAHQLAKKLNVSKEDLELIEQYASFKARLNTNTSLVQDESFKKELSELTEKVNHIAYSKKQ